MPSWNFVSGTNGSLSIGGVLYPADMWEWDMHCANIEVPTVSSMPYCDMGSGAKKLMFRASGTIANNFNPFADGAGGNVFLRTYQNVVVTAYAPRPSVIANGKILITQWVYRDEADGKATWNLTGYGAWQFTNMAQTYH